VPKRTAPTRRHRIGRVRIEPWRDPASLSVWDQMVWEVEHYALHMQLTFEAILTWFVSPQLGWHLLNSQTLCADQGRMTEHLFDTGMHALETFFLTIVVMAWVGWKSHPGRSTFSSRALITTFARQRLPKSETD
jgi:hypothetical protein